MVQKRYSDFSDSSGNMFPVRTKSRGSFKFGKEPGISNMGLRRTVKSEVVLFVAEIHDGIISILAIFWGAIL
jgi:hypothetical protein